MHRTICAASVNTSGVIASSRDRCVGAGGVAITLLLIGPVDINLTDVAADVRYEGVGCKDTGKASLMLSLIHI